MAEALWPTIGVDVRRCPAGAFYLWAPGARTATPGRSPAGWPPRAARSCRPGEFYGPDGADHVRIAVVQPDDRIALVAKRLGAV